MKLVNFARAWHLGDTSPPLNHQEGSHWVFGPVIQDIYNALRSYGGEPTPRLIAGCEFNQDCRPIDDFAWDIIRGT